MPNPPGTVHPAYSHAGHNGDHYLWTNYTCAKALADHLSSDDPNWRYQVRKEGNHYVIQVWDEDDHFLGNL